MVHIQPAARMNNQFLHQWTLELALIAWVTLVVVAATILVTQ